MTGYKRASLLFRDPARLAAIAARGLQIVVPGKAHPRDEEGKHLIAQVVQHTTDRPARIVFVEGYDMRLARLLVAGVDLWLNTPHRPMEASGTSGMKSLLGGVPNLSVLDGWWIEGWDEGVTGWAIGNDDDPPDATAHAAALYHKLENTVLPLYYSDRARWIWMMKQAIAKIGSVFNSQRMMRRYTTEAYVKHGGFPA